MVKFIHNFEYFLKLFLHFNFYSKKRKHTHTIPYVAHTHSAERSIYRFLSVPVWEGNGRGQNTSTRITKVSNIEKNNVK